MGWVVPLIPYIAAAGSAYASYEGNNRAKDAQNARIKEELQRQKGYEKKSRGVYDASLAESGVGTARKQIGEGRDQALAEYDKVGRIPLSVSSSSAIAPSQNTQVNDQRQQASNAQAGQQRAPLVGYNEFDLKQWIKNLRAQQQLAIISQQAGQSNSILPYELEGASHAGDDLQGKAALLGTAGTLLGAYQGMMKPTTAPAKPPPKTNAGGPFGGRVGYGFGNTNQRGSLQ